jgi:ABC-type amino acid transport substrate-binding protein
MNKKFKLALVALLVISLLTLAGCNNQQPQAENQQEENNSQEEIVLKVGTEPSFPPFEYTNEKNEIIGFDIDLIKAIGEDQGFKVEVQQLGFDGLILALQSGNIDIAASGMSIKPERLEQVDFSEPYIDAGLAIAVANSNDTIKGEEDLQDKKVAVQIGTTGASKAQELLDAGVIKEVKTFPTVDVVMMELINGGVDAVINDLPVTEAYMSKQPDKIKIVGDVLESESYGFAVRKGNTELLEKINAGLKNVQENGKFAEIQNKYFGQ